MIYFSDSGYEGSQSHEAFNPNLKISMDMSEVENQITMNAIL